MYIYLYIYRLVDAIELTETPQYPATIVSPTMMQCSIPQIADGTYIVLASLNGLNQIFPDIEANTTQNVYVTVGCDPAIVCNGHGECVNDTACSICYDGWSGPNCNQMIGIPFPPLSIDR